MNQEDDGVLSIPEGLLGLPELKHLQIVYAEDELPFLRLREISDGKECLEFLVIEPAGIIENYQIEINDEDQLFLGVQNPDDLLILNIVTFHPGKKTRVTVNLMGPILINRRTHRGKQVIVDNYVKYSAEYLLHEE
ncbi:MAG: hypothetical protein A2Y14_01620 [Verrucomicrobia bacterium GWF2_51_19]|nr:MAG: hypothetical protein A2Y14_01620 [Verrucomicrobia bacterium GWF2_51_19]